MLSPKLMKDLPSGINEIITLQKPDNQSDTYLLQKLFGVIYSYPITVTLAQLASRMREIGMKFSTPYLVNKTSPSLQLNSVEGNYLDAVINGYVAGIRTINIFSYEITVRMDVSYAD